MEVIGAAGMSMEWARRELHSSTERQKVFALTLEQVTIRSV